MFLRTFLAISALSLFVWQSSLYADAVLDFRRRSDAAAADLNRARAVLETTLRSYWADVMVVALGPDLRRLAAGDEGARDAVTQNFMIFASEKPVFVQIRYLDRAGMEQVRVERRSDDVFAVDQAELQDKSDRYYFQQSIGLPAGALYASPIDLNVEHDAIETPWRPMLRLATPIVGADGDTQGVVIINIAASDLIDRIRRANAFDRAPIQFLNDDGYWLAGAPREQLWGFMFNRPTSMAASNPEVWAQIRSARPGAVDSRGVRYAYATLQPPAPDAGVASGAAVQASETWKLVAVVPKVTLLTIWRREQFAPAAMGLLFIILISWGWSGAVAARREAEREKKEAETALASSEKLASLGALVAGVAHELNTPIGNTVTVASTLADRVSELESAVDAGQIRRSALDTFVQEARDGAAIILNNIERASTLIGHFKQVAVDQTSERRRVFALADLVDDVAAAVRPQFPGQAVTFKVAVASKAFLDSYPGPLGQVLINLITNARIHAFTEDDHGVVSLTARDLSSREVEIVVRDTGRGVTDEVREKMFEPFFTTRLGDGGSGLGLSIAHNIVANVLGGTIRVESALGAGTTIIVRIPMTAPARAGEDAGDVYDTETPRAA